MIRSRRLRALFIIEAAAIFALIFLFSSQDGERSGRLSGMIARFIYLRLPRGTIGFQRLHHLVRKTGHFTEFAALGQAVACLICCFTGRGFPFVAGGSALALCAVSAALDELHQGFVDGRAPALGDVLIDSGGAACGIALSLILTALILARQKGHRAA